MTIEGVLAFTVVYNGFMRNRTVEAQTRTLLEAQKPQPKTYGELQAEAQEEAAKRDFQARLDTIRVEAEIERGFARFRQTGDKRDLPRI